MPIADSPRQAAAIGNGEPIPAWSKALPPSETRSLEERCMPIGGRTQPVANLRQIPLYFQYRACRRDATRGRRAPVEGQLAEIKALLTLRVRKPTHGYGRELSRAECEEYNETGSRLQVGGDLATYFAQN